MRGLTTIKYRANHRFAAYFFLTAAFLIILVVGIIFVPSASVTIFSKSEPLAANVKVLLDPSLTSVPPQLAVIPARVMQRDYLVDDQDWITNEQLKISSGQDESLIFYRQSDLELVVNREMSAVLRNDWQLQPQDRPKIIWQSVSIDKYGSAVIGLRAESVAVPIFPYEEWRDKSGHRVKNLSTLIKSSTGVNDFKISVFPSFWPFLPVLSSRLNISLDIL